LPIALKRKQKFILLHHSIALKKLKPHDGCFYGGTNIIFASTYKNRKSKNIEILLKIA